MKISKDELKKNVYKTQLRLSLEEAIVDFEREGALNTLDIVEVLLKVAMDVTKEVNKQDN